MAELLTQTPPMEAIAKMTAIAGVRITPTVPGTQQGQEGHLGPEAAGAVLILPRGGRHGTRLLPIVWLAVFAGQTALLLSVSEDIRDRDTGGWELAYFPIALAILALGFALLHAGATIRRHRSAAPGSGLTR